MLTKSTAEAVLAEALTTGGDVAEIFMEDTVYGTISMIDGNVDKAANSRDHGAGIRIYQGLNAVYVHTNDTSLEGLLACARKGAAALNAEKVQITFSRSLPVNDLEIAQTLATYQGMVPEKLLLAQVPFVEDAEAAGKLLNRERAEAAGRQREAFEITPFRKDAGEDDQGREG